MMMIIVVRPQCLGPYEQPLMRVVGVVALASAISVEN